MSLCSLRHTFASDVVFQRDVEVAHFARLQILGSDCIVLDLRFCNLTRHDLLHALFPALPGELPVLWVAVAAALVAFLDGKHLGEDLVPVQLMVLVVIGDMVVGADFLEDGFAFHPLESIHLLPDLLLEKALRRDDDGSRDGFGVVRRTPGDLLAEGVAHG